MSRIPDTAPHSHLRRTGTAVAACLAVATVVSGCGGGDKVKPFQPAQVIAFGDENSAFDDSFVGGPSAALVTVNGAAFKGSRYTINLVSPTAVYCTTNVNLWTATDCAVPNRVATPNTPVFSTLASPVPSEFTIRTETFIGNEPRYRLVNRQLQGTYTVGVTTNNPLYLSIDNYYDCAPRVSNYAGNWVQTLASSLGSGLSFGGDNQCAQDSGNGISYAKWGAKVADVAAQVSANRAQLHDGVLVTVLAGQNDIRAAYEAVTASTPTMSESAALFLMSQKGIELANVINDIVATGARVVYLTVPDMGQTPKAVADNKSALATRLTQAFNEGYNNQGGLVLSVVSNGHKIVKVDGYSQIRAVAPNYPYVGACETDVTASNYPKQPDGSAITTDPALLERAILLNCTNGTLIQTNKTAPSGTTPTYASVTSHLWADNWHLGPLGHASLAALAATRVRDQL